MSMSVGTKIIRHYCDGAKTLGILVTSDEMIAEIIGPCLSGIEGRWKVKGRWMAKVISGAGNGGSYNPGWRGNSVHQPNIIREGTIITISERSWAKLEDDSNKHSYGHRPNERKLSLGLPNIDSNLLTIMSLS